MYLCHSLAIGGSDLVESRPLCREGALRRRWSEATMIVGEQDVFFTCNEGRRSLVKEGRKKKALCYLELIVSLLAYQ